MDASTVRIALISSGRPRAAARNSPNPQIRGADMGDKGGKKDKAKQKQQQLKKHKDDEQRKQDHGPAKPSVTRSQLAAAAPAAPRL
jgi:hypothetical protein